MEHSPFHAHLLTLMRGEPYRLEGLPDCQGQSNDAITRARCEESLIAYMRGLTTRRTIDCFSISCNETCNSPWAIDHNELWVDVTIWPRSIRWASPPLPVHARISAVSPATLRNGLSPLLSRCKVPAGAI